MDKTRYIEILAAYGANPKRWPASERETALRLSEKCPDLQSASSTLDQALDAKLSPASDNALLAARILKQANSTPQDAPPEGITRLAAPQSLPWKSLAATLLLCGSLGYGLGITGAQTTPVYTQTAEIEAFLLAQNDEIYDWTLEVSP